MALEAGTQLGPYEIVAPLGAGGQGEVYRAKDSKLGRDVAIKVLPDELAQDEETYREVQRARGRGYRTSLPSRTQTWPATVTVVSTKKFHRT